MKFRVLVFSLFLLSLFNCKSTATLVEIAALKKVVSKESFEIIANSANPIAFVNVRGIENLLPIGSNQANINLTGNQNYFRVQKDSIDFDLPFYGERHSGGGYASNNGLKFKGKIKEQKITFNAKKNQYLLEYSLHKKREIFQVLVTLYANKTSRIDVSSSNRSAIVYNGNWKALEK
jgi:hypothetical protein